MYRMQRVANEHPERFQIQLTHFRQRYSWDCGLTCVLMVLNKEDRQDFQKNFNLICKEEGFNKNTWTIDLCYILKRYNLKYIYYTITLGVHPGYKKAQFYHQVYLNDESRVNTRFKDAAKQGLQIRKGRVSCSDILNHLIKGPVIILTNAKLLICDVCKFNKISNAFRNCIPWPVSYEGHYIVLCGYNIRNQRIYYHNPSFGNHVCSMPLEILESARKSYGTDEDVIFIFK